MDLALDSVWNGLFGIAVSLWSTVFVESWKNKQHTLIHLWDLDSIQEVLKNDEMKRFKYVNSYCTETHTKQKNPIGQDHTCLKFWNLVYMAFATAISIALMIYFESITYDEIEDFTTEVVLNQIKGGFFDPWTLLYALVLMVVDFINNYVVTWFIEKRNYRYKKDYFDSLHLQKFVFGFIGFFLPLGYVAFIRQSYIALFTLMFMTILIDQFKSMVMRIVP